jgi:hypothetical protein
MKALEFETRLNPDQTLAVPQAVAAHLTPGQVVRVLILVAEPTEEQEWQQLTAAEFFKGYAESDRVYDNLPGG